MTLSSPAMRSTYRFESSAIVRERFARDADSDQQYREAALMFPTGKAEAIAGLQMAASTWLAPARADPMLRLLSV
jgi:hypothetical protein